MSFFANNAAALAVGVVVSVMGWLFGGTRGDLLVPVVPWLLALMVEVLVCFPQRHVYENTYDARARVWSELKKDPLTWVVVGFLGLLVIPFVNNGLCANCDAALIAQGVSPDPPVKFLPFCVNRREHLNVFLWFLTAMPALLIVRHSLLARGKRLVLELAVWNGAALALLGFAQHGLGAVGPLWNSGSGMDFTRAGVGYGLVSFFSTFGYTNMAGDYFSLLFGLAIALWRDNCDRLRCDRSAMDISSAAAKRPHAFWKKHYFLIPAVLCFYAALNTMSRAAILMATVSATIYILHAFAAFIARLHKRVERVRALAFGVLGIGLLVFVATLFLPDGIESEMGTTGTAEVLNRVSGKGAYHTRVATEIWKDNKLFGCGGWGYMHFCRAKMRPGENLQIVGGINVHNDYLQFLAEHGAVGLGLLVAIVTILVWPIGREWRTLAREARFKKPRDLPAKPVQIFVLPSGAFCLLVALACTFVHAFGDCPFRSPAILTLFFVTLAALPGFMPKKGY